MKKIIFITSMLILMGILILIVPEMVGHLFVPVQQSVPAAIFA